MSRNYDVIIAGCGAAGLYAAINLPSELNILIICKRELSLCNSSLAQGGIAGVYNSPSDNIQYHQNDTLIAGSFKNNVDAVHTLVSEAAQDIEHIIKLGVDFDKNADGSYHRTLEGGHSHHRIFHHADSTGKEIASTLLERVKELKNVEIRENCLMCGVKQTSTGYTAFLRSEDGSYENCNCHFMILATGGIGRVYQFTTNSAIATGDGITFAYEMGAKIKNLSYVQFHPTAFNNRATRECFLISEAVRGEGAYLLNCHKERFMQNYDERLELAPAPLRLPSPEVGDHHAPDVGGRAALRGRKPAPEERAARLVHDVGHDARRRGQGRAGEPARESAPRDCRSPGIAASPASIALVVVRAHGDPPSSRVRTRRPSLADAQRKASRRDRTP